MYSDNDRVRLHSPLSHPTANGSQSCINLPRRRTENERNDGVPGNFDILERAQNVDLAAGIRQIRSLLYYIEYRGNSRVSEDNPRPTCILYRVSGFTILASYASCEA